MEIYFITHNPSKFEEALHTMIREHDAGLGITWITIDHYLNEYCIKENKYYEKKIILCSNRKIRKN